MKINNQLVDEAVKALGFISLNKMQEEMVAKGMDHHDLVLYAPTGTGKTLGFLLISLHDLHQNEKEVQALIIVPSRELALQLEQVFRKMNTGLKVNSCYGGHSVKTEINNFREPPDLLIGTPGRIADHLKRERFKTEKIKTLILDEFDKSLEMGFSEDMQFIISRLDKLKKRILTSATVLKEIPAFTGIKDPIMLSFSEVELQPNYSVKAVRSDNKNKLAALKKLIYHLKNESTLIFCNHREAVERISELLMDEDIPHDIFHGGLDQEKRERALIKFRNGSLHFLITTDLASRGLDIPEVQNVIHYQLPAAITSFTHRNGRTARMKAQGTIWLILSETERLPSYLEKEPEFIELKEEINLADNPQWITLYFGGGKKDKIGKTDVVGLLIQQGGLKKEEIGLITIQDYSSFAAVKREHIGKTLKQLKDCKLKGKKVKIEISD